LKKNIIETTIKKSFDDFLLNNLEDFKEIPYKIKIGKNKYANTAYYFLEPPHNIVIGNKILDNVKINKFDNKHYIESFLFHELSHSFWSHSIKKVNEILNKLKIPFDLYNIFEDARIENKFRNIYKRDFLWINYEKHNYKEITPNGIFFYFIFTENEKYKSNLDITLVKKIISNENFNKVRNYYKETIKINDNDFKGLFKLIKDFYNEFKDENNMNENPSFLNSEFIISNNINSSQSLEEIKNDLDKNSETIVTTNDNKNIENEIDKEFSDPNLNIEANSISDEDKKKHYYFFETNKDIISKKLKTIEELAKPILNNRKLKRLFKQKFNIELKETFSKKMSINKLVLDEDKIYKHSKKSRTGEKKKKKTISLIVDTSGSMQYISKYISTIIYIFNKLNQKKYIHLNIILSGPYKQNYALPLPVKDEDIASIVYDGAHEGFFNSINEHLNILKKSNYIFVLTDGLITDKPINKNDLNRKGIFTRAIYMFPKNSIYLHYHSTIQESLSKYFNNYIMKEDIESIFEEIILKFKKI